MWRDSKSFHSLSLAHYAPLSLGRLLFVVRPVAVRFTWLLFVAIFIKENNKIECLLFSLGMHSEISVWFQFQDDTCTETALEQMNVRTQIHTTLQTLWFIRLDSNYFRYGKKNFAISNVITSVCCVCALCLPDTNWNLSTNVNNSQIYKHEEWPRATDRPPAPFQSTLLPLSQSFIFTINGIRKHKISFVWWSDKN